MNALGLNRPKREAAQDSQECERVNERQLFAEAEFAAALCRERKRAERSGRAFALMLVESGVQLDQIHASSPDLLVALGEQMRETDVVGWHRQGAVAGAILTEFGGQELPEALDSIRRRISAELQAVLSEPVRSSLRITFHVFPDAWDIGSQKHVIDFELYPDLSSGTRQRVRDAIKRALDIVGSLGALLLLAPLFALIAFAVRMTSKGPALFRQQRVGQFGRTFTMYKFRSMCIQAAPERHKKFVEEFISGKMASPGAAGLYKMTDDPRITPLGRFLRRTSLDELPQFFNVLCGEMSLVGPRPPLPYELQAYTSWHRRRLLEAKPGLTGLWQVSGRSKTRFNDMVRLDLRYARTQSVWLDLSLIFKTLRVIFSDEGAR